MGSKEIDDWHYFKLRRGYDMKIRKPEEQLGIIAKDHK
jgi:hypothetical protein